MRLLVEFDTHAALHGCKYAALVLLLVSSCSRVDVQAQDNVGWKNKKAEVCFLLDSSSSVWVVDYAKLRTLVSDLVSDMDVGPMATRVGIGVFAENFKMHVSIANPWSKETLKQEILKAPYLTGNTYISRALKGLREQCLSKSIVRPNIPLIAVLFTDGQSRHKQLTADNATLAKQEGITLFTVGIGSGVNRDELQLIASEATRDFSYQVADFDHLADIRAQLSSRMSQVIVYTGDEGTCGERAKADIVFVFDKTAVGDKDTQRIKAFIAAVTENFSMNSGRVRIGVVSKTCHQGDIKLGQYTNKEDFTAQLQINDGPEITDLLREVRLYSFLPENGARSEAKKRIVLILHSAVARRAELLREALRVNYAGIELFVIRIGNDYDKDFINSLASRTEFTMYPGMAEDLIKKDEVQIFTSSFCADL